MIRPIVFGSLFILVCFADALVAETDSRPNILYFYVDDMGWGSIGPNGQAARRDRGLPSVKTPNLDRLAANGLNFRRGYGCFVCSPARSSQQSGFHQGHTFADRNDPNNAKKAMRADDILMGDALSAAGYVTGYWGKWGYGGSKDIDNPKIDNIQTLPTSHGYQHVLAELHHVRAHTFFQPTLWKAPAPKGAVGGLHLVPNSMAAFQNKRSYPNTPARQNNDAYPRTAYCDDSYAFAALDFVREQGQNFNQTGQPFFGLLAVQIPHAPFQEITTLPNWDEAYRNDPHFNKLADQSRQWAAMVTRIDGHFGNLLAALEDPNHDGDTSDSIADNTLVIFQSDNGGPAGKNNIELDANGGLRGNKGKIQEGGIRVPLVMRWPAKINSASNLKSGSSTDMVVDVTDLLPTFCELAQTEIPLGIDGVSIAPTLTGEGKQRKRDFIIHEAGNGQSIIRGGRKLVRSKSGKLTLYDLESDHAEEIDLAKQNPGLVNELKTLLLGERVTEPKGFANTYHHWTGDDGGETSNPDNWSDYVYENAGEIYMTDEGAPQLAWVARMVNSRKTPQRAIAESNLEFLAFSVGGKQAKQTLELKPKVSFIGRNEIRVNRNGVIRLDRSTMESLRWIEIAKGGEVSGMGQIVGTVFNGGRFDIAAGGRMGVRGDFHHLVGGKLNFDLKENQIGLASISGVANLKGEISVTVDPSMALTQGDSFAVLRAEKIIGRFSNEGPFVIADDGTRFHIHVGESKVTLTVDGSGHGFDVASPR